MAIKKVEKGKPANMMRCNQDYDWGQSGAWKESTAMGTCRQCRAKEFCHVRCRCAEDLGGKVESGESFLECAIRELDEEKR